MYFEIITFSVENKQMKFTCVIVNFFMQFGEVQDLLKQKESEEESRKKRQEKLNYININMQLKYAIKHKSFLYEP